MFPHASARLLLPRMGLYVYNLGIMKKKMETTIIGLYIYICMFWSVALCSMS